MKKMVIQNPNPKLRERIERNMEMAAQNAQVNGLAMEEAGNDIVITLSDDCNDWAAEGFDYILEYTQGKAYVTVE